MTAEASWTRWQQILGNMSYWSLDTGVCVSLTHISFIKQATCVWGKKNPRIQASGGRKYPRFSSRLFPVGFFLVLYSVLPVTCCCSCQYFFISLERLGRLCGSPLWTVLSFHRLHIKAEVTEASSGCNFAQMRWCLGWSFGSAPSSRSHVLWTSSSLSWLVLLDRRPFWKWPHGAGRLRRANHY